MRGQVKHRWRKMWPGVKERPVQLENLNVEQQEVLITPEQLKARLPRQRRCARSGQPYRETVRNIVDRKDPRYWWL